MAAKERKAAPAFTKQQILSAEKYMDRRDLLNVLLSDGKSYTLAEVTTEIDSFMKKEFDKIESRRGK
ncbi:hypothetical protein HA075_01075 [bacterium BFN5]|nr:hypothetical protein HA075_00615 [bacterium BFN5]QJW44557.1 hypothetical protein HA075_01075 [bacterium BFN5]